MIRSVFACNIHRGGRALRIVAGLVLVFDAILLAVFDMPGTGIWSRVLQLGLGLLGAFALFEGLVGWCAVRALGYRTKL